MFDSSLGHGSVEAASSRSALRASLREYRSALYASAARRPSRSVARRAGGRWATKAPRLRRSRQAAPAPPARWRRSGRAHRFSAPPLRQSGRSARQQGRSAAARITLRGGRTGEMECWSSGVAQSPASRSLHYSTTPTLRCRPVTSGRARRRRARQRRTEDRACGGPPVRASPGTP